MFKIFVFLSLPILFFGQTLKIASYNVENLFDMHRDGTEYAEYVPGHHGWDEAMLERKIRNITKVICDLDADVIGLQEVENDRVLSVLQKSLRRAGCRYRYRAITHTKRTPIHTALLSRIPLTRVRDLPVTRYGLYRSILEVTLDTDPPLKVFVNHWKSKRGPESGRIPYAKALKNRLEKMPKNGDYILLGDFNSNYNESATIDKKHNDTGGITGINNVLKTTRANGQMVRLSNIRPGELCNLWMDVEAGSRWTHNFFGDKEGIDAMIIPPSLVHGVGWRYVRGSFGAYRPRYLFGHHGRINRWAYRHGKHMGKGYSDHLPVSVLLSNSGVDDAATVPQKISWWHKLWDRISGAKGEERKDAARQNLLTPAKEYIKPKIAESSIEHILTADIPQRGAMLKEACVVFKRGDSAVIQQKTDGKAVLLYRSARQIEEGNKYDLTVYKKKRYKGFDELTDIEVSKSLGGCDPQKFIADFEPGLMNEMRNTGKIVANIKGRLEGRKIYIDSKPYPIHFRRSAGWPKNGNITIKQAMIGYYKDHMELVVWSKRDWSK